MIILNHTTKYLFIEWDDGWNTDFFTLPVIGFASTNLNFKSVFVRRPDIIMGILHSPII